MLPVVSVEVFLSYRRDDAQAEAGRLHDALIGRFGHGCAFMDTTDVPVADDWPGALRSAVSEAHVVIVVIGPEWLLARDEWGRRRIDDERDWVRQEILLALQNEKALMPLLVRHASMFPPKALPDDISSLATKQARSVRGETWNDDVEVVIRHVARLLGRGEADVTPLSERAEAPLTASFTPDDLRVVALGFDSADIDVRRATVLQLKDVAAFLKLADVLAFTHSRRTAERIAAAVALGVHIRSSAETRADRRVRSALGELLVDRRSLVRYRAAQVLRFSPTLVPTYEDDLARLKAQDPNSSVREMATSALRAAGRSG